DLFCGEFPRTYIKTHYCCGKKKKEEEKEKKEIQLFRTPDTSMRHSQIYSPPPLPSFLRHILLLGFPLMRLSERPRPTSKPPLPNRLSKSLFFDHNHRAKLSLQNLCQTGTVLTYTQEFNLHYNTFGWADTALMSLYQHRLKENIQISVVMSKIHLTSLQAMQKMALKAGQTTEGIQLLHRPKLHCWTFFCSNIGTPGSYEPTPSRRQPHLSP
ncbi:uncharacterized protein VP01_6146g1, partial [Puccinia sorghi]